MCMRISMAHAVLPTRSNAAVATTKIKALENIYCFAQKDRGIQRSIYGAIDPRFRYLQPLLIP